MAYKELSRALCARIEQDKKNGTFGARAFSDENAIRRNAEKDRATLWRPTFVRDAEKILHCPLYNRYTDKTQVFSFYRNDDISRRALHVQLVSRIARNVGRCLGLNLDLIEAIALGHDIGHTPFGHAGEHFLSEQVYAHTGKYFLHNVQSARVLDGIFPYNITLQTLNGILTHNGENELPVYTPSPMTDFSALDDARARAAQDPKVNNALMPSTLEACTVRLADLIAYLGKDRQDAARAGISIEAGTFSENAIGSINAEIINNLTVSAIENSYDRPYLAIGEEEFAALAEVKSQNYEHIYLSDAVSGKTRQLIAPLFEKLYDRLLADLASENRSSPIFTHHIAQIEAIHYERALPYREEDANTIVTDYIASMTDDYFVDLCAYLFPSAPKVPYIGYFDGDT